MSLLSQGQQGLLSPSNRYSHLEDELWLYHLSLSSSQPSGPLAGQGRQAESLIKLGFGFKHLGSDVFNLWD